MKDGKYEVGDRVKARSSDIDITAGKGYAVTAVEDYEFSFSDDAGDERWRNHDNDEWSLFPSISPGDTVRLNSGEPFTDGEYTATVDNVTADGVVLLTTGGWLAGELVDKVEALTVEVGKSYVARDGSIIGPMVDSYGDIALKGDGHGRLWCRKNGRRLFNQKTDNPDDLISEHVLAATAPTAAEWVPKVGDRVRIVRPSCCVDRTGREGPVIEVEDEDARVTFDDGNPMWQDFADIELVTPAHTPTTTNDNLTITITGDFSALADQFERVAAAIRAAA